MKWKLHEVKDIECTMDKSGIYCMIARVKKTGGISTVRLDLMSENNCEPLVSFIGPANAVRKHTIKWIWEHSLDDIIVSNISTEHASYIGYELSRAERKINYVQD